MSEEYAIGFRFIEFHARRHSRRVEAARVAIINGEEENWLWMNKKDIRNNMLVYGNHPELVKALEAYP